MPTKRTRALVITTAIGGVLALATVGATLGPLSAVNVSVAPATVETLQVSAFGIGTLEARHAYAIGPTQTGRVSDVLVDHGDRVRAGQLLAEMDPIDLNERLASTGAAAARALDAVRAAHAQTREAEARVDLAAANQVRYHELAAKGFVSREAAEQRRSEADVSRAALEAARAQTDAALRDVDRLERDRAALVRQVGNLKLRSPVDAVVIARQAEPGNIVVAGQPVLKLIAPSSVWVRARLDQARAGSVRAGQPARIELRSARGGSLAGRVVRVDLQSDALTEERIVNVAFDGPPPSVSIGELVEVRIEAERIANALVVPGAAVRRVGDEFGVWRVEHGRARFQTVQAGAQSLDGRIQILSGVAEGDQVIVHASRQLSQGDRVRVAASP